MSLEKRNELTYPKTSVNWHGERVLCQHYRIVCMCVHVLLHCWPYSACFYISSDNA